MIIEDIIFLLLGFFVVELYWSSREGNLASDWLVKLPIKGVYMPDIWMISPPLPLSCFSLSSFSTLFLLLGFAV